MTSPIIEFHYAYRAVHPEAMEGVFCVGNREHLAVPAVEAELRNALDWDATFVADQLGVPELAPWAYAPMTWNSGRDASRHVFLRLRGLSAIEALRSGPVVVTHDVQDLISSARTAQRAGWNDFVMENGARRYGSRRATPLALAG